MEAWLDERWRRFDAEVDVPRPALLEPMDMATCPRRRQWVRHRRPGVVGFRRGDLDAEAHGVGPEVPGFRGPCFLFDEVIIEVAHRFGDELLLWDGWGRIGEPDRAVGEDEARWLDETPRCCWPPTTAIPTPRPGCWPGTGPTMASTPDRA